MGQPAISTCVYCSKLIKHTTQLCSSFNSVYCSDSWTAPKIEEKKPETSNENPSS